MNSEEYAERYLGMLFDSRKQLIESLVQKPISGEEYVIEYLSEHPGPAYPSEISEKMQTSTARVAAILKHLEYVSVILRNEDPEDARKHPVELSPAGYERAKEIHLKRVKNIASVFDAIGEEETREFIKISNHIIEVCKRMEVNIEKLSDSQEGSA